MGAWVSYGLGSENRNLPGFIVLNGGLIPPGGLDNFNSGFLPAAYQGSVFRPGDPPVANIGRCEPSDAPAARQARPAATARSAAGGARSARADEIESAIANYETAYRMQTAVPELMDVDGRDRRRRGSCTASTRNIAPTQIFGRQCLIARRLVERGARFIELTCPNVGARPLGPARRPASRATRTTPAPSISRSPALLKDLKARGLLESTLVVWAGEFGRTPFAQGSDGRDHNPFGFTVWLAGGGVKGGIVYGETDEWGYKVVDEQGGDPRPARDHAAPARRRSQAADVPLRRPRHAADRRAWRGGARNPGVT